MRGRLYGDLNRAWREGLAGEVRRTALAFPIVYLLVLGACLARPGLLEALVDRTLSTISGLPLTDETGALSAVALFVNNFRACGFIMLYGLLPFLFLPALSLGVHAMMLAALAAWYLTQGTSLLVYLALLLPHGIFELPALVLAFATGLFICGQMTRRCRRDKTAWPAWDCLILASHMLVLVLLPLLAVSALLETYVTPLIASSLL